jgi:hypothetical protein
MRELDVADTSSSEGPSFSIGSVMVLFDVQRELFGFSCRPLPLPWVHLVWIVGADHHNRHCSGTRILCGIIASNAVCPFKNGLSKG